MTAHFSSSGMTTRIKELVLLLVTAAVFHVDAACDSDWTADGANCYKAYNERSDRKSFDKALSLCQELGATLATVGDASKNAFIAGLIDNPTASRLSVWIGAQCNNSDQNVLTWTESDAPGASTVTTAWRNWFNPPQLQPFPKDITDSCVTVMDGATGFYRNSKCARRHNYVCQKSADCNPDNCVGCVADNYCAKCENGYADVYNNGLCVDLSTACEHGYTLDFANQQCFKLSSAEVSFSEAAAECGGAIFARVADAEQSKFLSNMISHNAWINEKWESRPGWVEESKRPPVPVTTDVNDCIMLPMAKGSRQDPKWQPTPCIKELPVLCVKDWNLNDPTK